MRHTEHWAAISTLKGFIVISNTGDRTSDHRIHSRNSTTEPPIHIALKRSYLPNPSARAGYDTRSIFKRSLTGLNSEFSFSWTSCLTNAEEISLPYYLPIAGGRIIGFIPFPRVLVLCEMQSVSSRIWTRVAVSISLRDTKLTCHHKCVTWPLKIHAWNIAVFILDFI